jgi:hypothetical protein
MPTSRCTSPVRAHRITLTPGTLTLGTMALGTLAVAFALTACGVRPDPAGPAPSATRSSAPSPSTPATKGEYPTVVGTLNVMIALTTSGAALPVEPVYSLAVKPRTGTVIAMYPVGSDGTFALAIPPGTYDVEYLELRAADLGMEPMVIPIASDRRLVLEVPGTGCRYGGEVMVVYGRLPAGTERQQQELVERASRTNKENYSFVFRPDGGFVLAGASVSLPASPQRPPAAAGCETAKFRLVASS